MNKLKMNGFRLMAIAMGIALLVACKKDKKDAAKEELVLASGSKALWTGYLETGYFNSGGIELHGDRIFLEGDKITGGEINIPISSIVITNELSVEDKIALLHHLQGTDFFNMIAYPYVTYTISLGEKKTIDENGNNYLIKGKMKLLGKELPLDIPAKINITSTFVSVNSNFKFDRTKWGMTFATSEQLPAKDKIKNEIEVEIDFNANRL